MASTQVANIVVSDPLYLDLRRWLIESTSEALEIDSATLDTNRNLAELGLDSLQAICIAGYLEEWLGLKIPETILEDYPTVEGACEYIMGMIPEFMRDKYGSPYILETEAPAAYSKPFGRRFRGCLITAA